MKSAINPGLPFNHALKRGFLNPPKSIVNLVDDSVCELHSTRPEVNPPNSADNSATNSPCIPLISAINSAIRRDSSFPRAGRHVAMHNQDPARIDSVRVAKVPSSNALDTEHLSNENTGGGPLLSHAAQTALPRNNSRTTSPKVQPAMPNENNDGGPPISHAARIAPFPNAPFPNASWPCDDKKLKIEFSQG